MGSTDLSAELPEMRTGAPIFERFVEKALLALERMDRSFGIVISVISLLTFGIGIIRYADFSLRGGFERDFGWAIFILAISPFQVLCAIKVRAGTLRTLYSVVLILSFLAAGISLAVYSSDTFPPLMKYLPLIAATLCVFTTVGMTYVIIARKLSTRLAALQSQIKGNIFSTLMFFVALFFNITILLSFSLAFDDQPMQRALSDSKISMQETIGNLTDGHHTGELAVRMDRLPLDRDLQKLDVSLYSMSVFDPEEARNILLGLPEGSSRAAGDVLRGGDAKTETDDWRFIFTENEIDFDPDGITRPCEPLAHVLADQQSKYWNLCEIGIMKDSVVACRAQGLSSVVTIWTPKEESATARAVHLRASLHEEFMRQGILPGFQPNAIAIQTSFSSSILKPSERWAEIFPNGYGERTQSDSSHPVLDITHECSSATAVESYASRLSKSRRLQLLDYIYFTTYTITTTGYGDIVPISGFAKFICSIANFFELFFVVVFFNCLVAAAGEKTKIIDGPEADSESI